MMKMLVVDDREENLRMLEALLEQCGHEVTSARNGQEALEKLRGDPLDMIISDILMPGMDGFQLCRECKADDALREIPFIFFTASYTNKKDREFALGLGAEEFVVKPIGLDDLVKIIDRVLRNHRADRPSHPAARVEEEEVPYLRSYNERLIHKLESKMLALEREISERRKAEEALRESERRFRTLVANIPGAVYRCAPDADRAMEFITDAVQDFCGYPASDFTGNRVRSYGSVIHPEDRVRVEKAIREGISRRKPHVAEYRVIRPDGDVRWVRENGQAVFDGKGDCLALDGIIFDQSVERILQQQLIQAEKLAAVGELVSGVAHEMNNPLTGIIGFAELLQMDTKGLDDGVKDKLKRVHSEGKRLERIVSNLLSFARKRAPAKVPSEVNNMVEQVLSLRRYDLEVSSVHVVTELEEQIPLVNADSQQIQQIFLNIINNAQQAITGARGKGTLTIRTYTRDSRAMIAFEDDGPGIPEEDLEHVFDPFFTTKEVGKGTGLGLSVSYGIVREHGGTLLAESEEGKGARFIVELPVAQE